MTTKSELKASISIHPSFFKEFASKTWLSPYSAISELVENSFDEDAGTVIITLLPDSRVVVEDDVGMDREGFDHFLIVGSPHKQREPYSPRFNRRRSGMYGTGRLGFLNAFRRMEVRTRRNGFTAGIAINEGVFEQLAQGLVELEEISSEPLNHEGTEIRLLQPKVSVSPSRLVRELEKLPCLRQPFFKLFFKNVKTFEEWSLEGSESIMPPEVEGLKIPVTLKDIQGVIVVSKHPLPQEERGISILLGGHTAAKTSFGFDTDRLTGHVSADTLTARFADKSAIVEDEAYNEFKRRMREFIKTHVLPKAEDYIESIITRREARIYGQVDTLLSEAASEILEDWAINEADMLDQTHRYSEESKSTSRVEKPWPKERSVEHRTKSGYRRTFNLRRIGYTTIPYEDEDDQREIFIEENNIYVNKAHPAYRAASNKTRILFRHMLRLISKCISLQRHPEGKDAVELQNRLIASAIRIRMTK